MTELHDAFVAAFEPYVLDRVGALTDVASVPGLDDAIADGSRWLDHQLEMVLGEDPARQRSSPLQLFQAALSFPTRVMQEAGIVAADRDETTADALPGDIYDLAPASSQALGERAWRAHVAWGIAKAEAVAGMVPVSPAHRAAASEPASPLAALVSTDLMDRSRIEGAGRLAGYGVLVWRNPAAVEAGIEESIPAVVFVDLTHAASDEIIPTLRRAGARIVAYGPHVDDIGLARALTLGADDAVSRSKLFTRLDRYFPPVV